MPSAGGVFQLRDSSPFVILVVSNHREPLVHKVGCKEVAASLGIRASVELIELPIECLDVGVPSYDSQG